MASEHTYRILLVDDEVDMDMATVDTLIRSGFSVVVANRAADCMSIVEREEGKIDAILLDVMMPPEGYTTLRESQGGRFTGAVLLRELRARLPDTPVIVVSAHTADEVRERLPGIAAFIEKPVTTRDLVNALHGALRRST